MEIKLIKIKYTIIFCILLSTNISAKIIYPDFMVSMTRRGNDFRKFEEFFIEGRGNHECYKIENLEVFRTAYTRNVLLAQQARPENRIPKIIHQIWLGSPVPLKYAKWMRSWVELAGWEYKLWTEEDVKDFLLYNQDLYDESKNFGEKSDVLRLEILLHYGGIYVDIDFECVNGAIFDELNSFFDFYVCFEPLCHGTMNGTYKICNAIVAACPYHPIIRNLVIGMNSNWQQHKHESPVEKSGPNYYSRVILDYEKGQLSSPDVKWNNSQYRNMYLPSTFLYPFSEPDVRQARSCQELIDRISPETAAIHYWSGSWLFQGGRDNW